MIGSNEYKFISDNLGQIQSEGNQTYSAIGAMREHLLDNELAFTNVDKQDLLRSIGDIYIVTLRTHVNITSEMRDAVVFLQRHVIEKSGGLDIFLQTNNILVTREFADLSEACGYTISEENIE